MKNPGYSYWGKFTVATLEKLLKEKKRSLEANVKVATNIVFPNVQYDSE